MKKLKGVEIEGERLNGMSRKMHCQRSKIGEDKEMEQDPSNH